ncbi:MAG: DUF2808 domain-containing protein [Microcoleaceae cyanobacterium]
MTKAVAGLTLVSSALVGLPLISLAQGGPGGLTIFSGVERENQLGFNLQSGQSGDKDRYKLRIPAKKLNLAVELISITYPDYYRGEFDPDEVEIRINGDKDQSVPLQEVVWDEENRFIEIYPEEPIAAGNKLEIVLHNVENPRFGGTYNFNANIRTPGDVPLTRYVGTWILSID